MALVLAVSAAVLLVVATALALRPRAAARSFAWIAVAGTAYSLLALAAALHAPKADGLRAAVVQLLAILLAAGLGGILPAHADDRNSSHSPLSAAARLFAWLALLGFPPTIGFHGRILVYRALLAAGWGWLAVLAMTGSTAALVPALWAIRSPRPASVRGGRALLAIALILVILALGLYPQAGLAVGQAIGNLEAAP